MWIAIIIGVVLLILAGILLWSGRMTQQLVNVMKQAVPAKASSIANAFPGELVSITGVARSDTPLMSEHGNVPCLYYSSTIERDYETTEYTHETKNQPARRTTRRVTETISSNTRSAAFMVEDETGLARVVPDDAEFDARETMNRFDPVIEGSNGTFSLGGFHVHFGDGDRTLGYRYKESIIPLDEPVYVVGVVTDDGEIAKPRDGRQNVDLIVSYRTEKALLEDWQESARWQAYGSIGSATAGLATLIIAAAIAIF